MVWEMIFVWRVNPIEAYEPCQVRKEAAISGYFYVGVAFHTEIRAHTILFIYMNIKDVKIWGTQLFIENLDHKHLMKW